MMDRIRLGDILHIKHGYAFKGEYFTDEDTGKLVLTPGNFSLKGGFQNTNKYTSEIDFPEEFILKPGDLIVTMTDLSKEIDTIGYSAIVPNDGKQYLHNQRIGLVTINNSEFDKGFVYWLMRSKHYQRSIANTSNGATVHHTSPDRIYNYQFEIIGIDTQRRIASILSTYDNLIENNNKRIRLLEQMAENLYKEWFVRFRFPGHEKAEFENGLPKGWRVERLEKIASFHTGRTDASEIKLYVSTENMIPNFGGIDFNLNIVPPNGNIISVEDKDILISNIRPYFKKIWFSNQRCGCSADVLNIRANNKDYSEYLYHSLRTDNFFDHIVAGSNGTKMPRGNKDFTMKYPIIVPSEEIMIIYSSIVGKMTQKRIKLQKENSLLSRQRDLLLPRLMSGKLEVKV